MKQSRITGLLLSGFASALAAPTNNYSGFSYIKTVDLGYAKYQGSYNSSNGVTSYLGVKYAADTSGNNRFRGPQSPQQVSELQYANKSGTNCLTTFVSGTGYAPYNTTQVNILDSSTYGEDCLFVNIYIPEGTNSSSKLPVLVNIHGGGYALNTVEPYSAAIYGVLYPGAGYIFVDVSYRLAAWGFLAGKEVGKDGNYNAGILDQQAALKWINKYICKFGGNPDHVTLYGESAGAGSLLQHVVANGGKTSPQLFKGIIASSVFTPPQYSATDYVVQGYYDSFVKAAGCSSSSNSLQCLRNASVDTLVQADYNVLREAGFGNYVFTPVVDGSFIQEEPFAALAAGRINGQNAWTSHNLQEGLIYGGLGNYTTQVGSNTTLQAEWIQSLWPHYNQSTVKQIQSLYNAQTFGTLQNATDLIYGENIFGCPAVNLAVAFAEHASGAHLSVFGYGPSNHGADILIIEGEGAESGYASPIVQSWESNIASYGTYNKVASNPWPAVDPNDIQYLNFNTTASMTAEANTVVTLDSAYEQRCAFWRSIASVTPQ